MIGRVREEETTWAQIPERFEAGTPPIAECLSFAAVLEQLRSIHDQYDIQSYEDNLFQYAWNQLSQIEGLTLFGPGLNNGVVDRQRSIISFIVDGMHAHDFASIADSYGVQVRAGHHCCMPAMEALEIESSARLSFGLYSAQADIDKLCIAIDKAKRVFS